MSKKTLSFIFLFSSLLYCEEVSVDISNFINLFYKKKYDEILQKYPIERISNTQSFLDSEIDFSFFYGVTYFAIGRYSDSIKITEKYSGQKAIISKVRFLSYLKLTNFEKASLELKKISPSTENIFFYSLLELSQAKISNGIEILKNYLLTEGYKEYNIEALLLDYTISFRNENLNILLDLINKTSIIEKNISEQIILVDSKTTSSPLNDFLEYKRIVESDLESEVKKYAFMKLIKNSSSSIIKNLASFEYRKLDER